MPKTGCIILGVGGNFGRKGLAGRSRLLGLLHLFAPLPICHEVEKLLCHMFCHHDIQVHGAKQPWTGTFETMNKINLSSFKLFSQVFWLQQ
jgi:hypothetical protein